MAVLCCSALPHLMLLSYEITPQIQTRSDQHLLPQKWPRVPISKLQRTASAAGSVRASLETRLVLTAIEPHWRDKMWEMWKNWRESKKERRIGEQEKGGKPNNKAKPRDCIPSVGGSFSHSPSLFLPRFSFSVWLSVFCLFFSRAAHPWCKSAKWVAYRRAAPMHVVLADFPFQTPHSLLFGRQRHYNKDPLGPRFLPYKRILG